MSHGPCLARVRAKCAPLVSGSGRTRAKAPRTCRGRARWLGSCGPSGHAAGRARPPTLVVGLGGLPVCLYSGGQPAGFFAQSCRLASWPPWPSSASPAGPLLAARALTAAQALVRDGGRGGEVVVAWVDFGARWHDLVDPIEDGLVQLRVRPGQEAVELLRRARPEQDRGDSRV